MSIGHGCVIGPAAAAGKGIQLIGAVPLIGGQKKADITTGLIHRWPLVANAFDVVGGLDMQNNGGVTFSAAGASFNGVNQWLSCSKTKPAAFSMSIWLTPVDFNARMSPFCSCNSAGNDYSIWGILSGTPASSALFGVGGSSSLLNVANEFTTANYPTTAKTLIVETYDGTVVCAYRGSVKIGEQSISPGTGSSTVLAIGRCGELASLYWKGSLSDARIYNRALTASEVAILAANGPNP